jgi:hypothetical protein
MGSYFLNADSSSLSILRFVFLSKRTFIFSSKIILSISPRENISPQVSELVVFASHSVCDGDALAILIRDILVYYANPEKEVQVLQPLNLEDCLPKERFSLPGLIAKTFINHYNRLWRNRPYYFTQMDFNEIHKAYWDKTRYNIALIQLEPEETSVLAAKCRENGVTITSASTAAFLAAYRDILGPFPKDKRVIWVAYAGC